MKERGARHGMLSAVRVAELCEVDLKTIHNWANRGKIRGARTAGRHLRFRRLDVVDFMRTHGFAIPEALRQARSRVVLIEADARARDALQRALSRRFEVTAFARVEDALLGLVAADPDIVVVGDASPLTGEAIEERLAQCEATKHVRVELAGDTRADVAAVRDRVERLAGMD